jgi:hypothetical protein
MKPNSATLRAYPSFVFMFKDDFWFSKVFIGGLVFLLSGIVVGIFLLLGYLAELMNGLLHDNEILPEWRHSGRFFSHGIRLVLAFTAYALPFAALNVVYHSAWLMAGSIILLLIVSPIIAAQYAFRFSLRDCFDWKSIIRFVFLNPLLFLRGILLSYCTMILSISFGWMILIVGWPFIIFWGMLVQAHMFAGLKKQSLIAL